MPSQEWSGLRGLFTVCAPKTVAALMAANPGLDPRGIDGPYLLAAEPAGVSYDEGTAAGLPAIWANPVHCDREQVLVYSTAGGSSAARRTPTASSPGIWPGRQAAAR